MKNEKRYALVTTGEEKSNEEIVLNNLLDYMSEKGMDAEQQKDYLKNRMLYLQYYRNVHKDLRHFLGMASISSLVVIAGAYYLNYENIKTLIASALLMMSGKVFYSLSRTNPYKEALMSYTDVVEMHEIYSDMAPVLLKNNKKRAR